MTMKKTNRLTSFARQLLLALTVSLFSTGYATAQEMMSAATSHYVIKVTPTLAYLDVGQAAGAAVGAEYIVLRADEDDDEMMLVVGEVRILRVSAGFSIAEITSIEPDEEISVLQQILPRADMLAKQAMEERDAEADSPERKSEPAQFTRSLVFLGGMDLSKAVDLTWHSNALIKAEDISGPAVAIRLGRMLNNKLRLALTYRFSGEPLGPSDAEVTQLSAELDAHILFRGAGKAGPYVGFGGGLHLLSWDASNDQIDDSAHKTGFNVLGGLEMPVAQGNWSLMAEGGYQGMTKWASMLNASHVRAYVGLGRNF
jgi:hypothetical protein